jgi:hypothetical protein
MTRWIKSPAWDLVWVLNALWLAPLCPAAGGAYDDVRDSPVDWLFFALAVPLWFGHRVSSAWLAYATPAYRPLLTAAAALRRRAAGHRRWRASRFLLAPGETCCRSAERARASGPIVDYLLVSYHFAAQHFGLLSLYRGRARARLGTVRATARSVVRAASWAAASSWCAEALAGSIAFQDRWMDPLLGGAARTRSRRPLREGGMLCRAWPDRADAARRTALAAASLPPRGLCRSASRRWCCWLLARPRSCSSCCGACSTGAPRWGSLARGAGAPQAPGARWHALLAPINRRGWAVVLVLAVLVRLAAAVAGGRGGADEYATPTPLRRSCAVAALSPFVPALLALGLRERLHPLPAGPRRLPLLVAGRFRKVRGPRAACSRPP